MINTSKNARNQMQIFNQMTGCAPSIGFNRNWNDKGLKVCKHSQGNHALETLRNIHMWSLSLFTFAGKEVQGGHTVYDVLSKHTHANGLYVNCHQGAAFHYLSRQDPITLDSRNTGALPAKAIATNAWNKQAKAPQQHGGHLIRWWVCVQQQQLTYVTSLI